MLLARLQDGALIRCDCMIMKRRNAMSEQLTRHKRLRLVKFLISSTCHRAHLGSESQPSGRLVLQRRCQLQGCLPSESHSRLFSFSLPLTLLSYKLAVKLKERLRGGTAAKTALMCKYCQSVSHRFIAVHDLNKHD